MTLLAFEEPGGPTVRGPVKKVFDGDGILTRLWNVPRKVECDVAVRFGFIDAPELEQPGGLQSKAYLESLVGGQWLDLALLTKDISGSSSDRWGRIFCVPYLLDDGPDGYRRSRNIELEMVLNGWAWVLDCWGPPDHYNDALSDARNNRRGIWARGKNVPPWAFKQRKRRLQEANSGQSDLFG